MTAVNIGDPVLRIAEPEGELTPWPHRASMIYIRTSSAFRGNRINDFKPRKLQTARPRARAARSTRFHQQRFQQPLPDRIISPHVSIWHIYSRYLAYNLSRQHTPRYHPRVAPDILSPRHSIASTNFLIDTGGLTCHRCFPVRSRPKVITVGAGINGS